MAKVFFGVPLTNKEETYENIIDMDKNNDYTTCNLLNYEYFSNNQKLIAIDLRKQVELADTMEKVNFIGRLEGNEGATMFLLLKKQKKQLLIFHKTLQVSYEMETHKIISLLNNSRNEESKFATKNGMSCDRQLNAKR